MKLRVVCAVAALGLGVASPVSADSNWIGVNALAHPQTPGWFVTHGTEVGTQTLPRWNSTSSIHAFTGPVGAPRISLFAPQPRLLGGAFGGTLGYAFGEGTLPPWLGQNVRIGLTGAFVSFRATNSASGTLGPSIGSITNLDGQVLGFFNATGRTISETLRVHRQGYDLNLRIASDFALMPGWTLTPSAAIFGGRVVDTYNFDSAFLDSGGTSFGTHIDEKLRTWSWGGDLSAGITWQATSALSINLTGRGGVVWQHSRLDGMQCRGGNTFSCFDDPRFLSFASDTQSRLGYRGGAALNASFDLRFGILTLGGFFLYVSAVPGVRNPAQTTLLLVSNTGERAHIHFDAAIRYGGFVNLRIPLLLR